MIQDVKKYKVSILNETYLLVSDEPEHLLLKSVDLVNIYLNEMLQNSGVNTKQSLVLALLKVVIKANKLEEVLK